jgi:hypothetical protein
MKRLTTLIAIITALSGSFSVISSAKAVSLKDSNEWQNLTVNPVQDRSTDTSGFQSLIPTFQSYVQKDGISIPEGNVRQLDPSKLVLKDDHDVRVWFVDGGAVYHDQLAYEATKGSSYQNGYVFSDASCKTGNNNNCAKPLDNGSLNVGDYVDLGRLTSGTQLNFWLRANGAQPSDPGAINPTTGLKNIYGTNAAQNPDKLDHIVAYAYTLNDRYLLVGFEDLFGNKGSTDGGNLDAIADRDFNDVVFAVDFGKVAAVPESTSAMALLGAGLVGMLKLRRQNKEDEGIAN